MKSLLYSVIFLLLFATCSKDEVESRQYPRVRTKPVSRITGSGALFQGEITSSSVDIVDHGFVWSTSYYLSLQSDEVFSLGRKPTAGAFEQLIERSLEAGKKYYVKAYAKSDKYTVYGDVVEFMSLGSKAPKVLSISPSKGTWNDTLTIVGQGYSLFSKNDVVKFDTIAARIIHNTNDSIICIVPEMLAKDRSNVSVSVFGNISSLENSFQLQAPSIISIDPIAATENSVITILGNLFSPNHTKVFFNNIEASLSQIFANKIVCKVPWGLPEGDVTIAVVTGSGNLRAEKLFILKKPKILNISPLQGTYTDIITIQGESFIPELTFIKFGNIYARLVSKTSTEIKAEVPRNLETPSQQISLEYAFDKIIYDKTFNLLPPEITDVTPEKVFSGSVITISGINFSPINNLVIINDVNAQISSISSQTIEAYMPVAAAHQLTVKVISSGQTSTYSKTLSYPLVKVGKPPFAGPLPMIQFVINDEIFVGGKDASGSNVFFNYQFDSDNWVVRTPPPIDIEGAFAFSVNSKGYVGGGPDSMSFWEYDPALDKWTQKNSLPISVQAASGFSISSKGYFVGGVNNAEYSPSTELWQYDPTNDTWMKKTDCPAYDTSQGFVYNGKFYARDNLNNYYPSLNIYDPLLETWTGEDMMTYDANFNPQAFRFQFKNEVFFSDASGLLLSYNLDNQTWLAVSDALPIINIEQVYLHSSNSVYLFSNYSKFELWELVPGDL